MQKLYSKKKLCCKTYYVLSMNLHEIISALAITESAIGGVLSEPFLNKVAGPRLLSLWHTFFPVTFAKFLRTPCLQNTSGRQLLLLYLDYQTYYNYNFHKFHLQDPHMTQFFNPIMSSAPTPTE